MKIRLAEVTKMLDDEGFERKGIEVDYLGERVGREWHDELVLVKEFPGITFKWYEDAEKTSVKYKDPEAREKIVAAIRTLKESHQEYEKKIRSDKVSAIKMYFDLRKTQKTINDIPVEAELW